MSALIAATEAERRAFPQRVRFLTAAAPPPEAVLAGMDAAGFGNCSLHGECEAVCPKGISIDNIGRMNADYLRSLLVPAPASTGGGEG
jgi:hypothetical protein